MSRLRGSERGCLRTILVVVALFFIAGWLMARRMREDARRWYAGHQAAEIAALRPPAMPPNCSSIDAFSPLRLQGGELADVRIFRFETTVYYVPSAWFRFDRWPTDHLVGGIVAEALGRLDPDLHPVECPGIVHRVTDRGLYLSDWMGVDLGRQTDAAVGQDPNDGIGRIFAQKLRDREERANDSLATDGLEESRNRQSLDAWIRVAPDVALRVTWHPRGMTSLQWQNLWLARRGMSPAYMAAVVQGQEFRRLARSTRALHAWLATPPRRRSGHVPSISL